MDIAIRGNLNNYLRKWAINTTSLNRPVKLDCIEIDRNTFKGKCLSTVIHCRYWNTYLIVEFEYNPNTKTMEEGINLIIIDRDTYREIRGNKRGENIIWL